jgi:hypothetical protein
MADQKQTQVHVKTPDSPTGNRRRFASIGQLEEHPMAFTPKIT